MGHDRDVKARVISLQLNTAGLFSLLGGSDNDKEIFLERWKGITTPAEFTMVESLFDTMNLQIEAVQRNTQALDHLAQGIRDRARAGSEIRAAK